MALEENDLLSGGVIGCNSFPIKNSPGMLMGVDEVARNP